MTGFRFPLMWVKRSRAFYSGAGRRRLTWEVFLRSLAPLEALGRGGVSLIVRRACRWVGLAPVGAHRLRHTLACEMVKSGVSLPEIAQVLRHRCLTSTGHLCQGGHRRDPGPGPALARGRAAMSNVLGHVQDYLDSGGPWASNSSSRVAFFPGLPPLDVFPAVHMGLYSSRGHTRAARHTDYEPS